MSSLYLNPFGDLVGTEGIRTSTSFDADLQSGWLTRAKNPLNT